MVPWLANSSSFYSCFKTSTGSEFSRLSGLEQAQATNRLIGRHGLPAGLEPDYTRHAGLAIWYYRAFATLGGHCASPVA